MPSCQLCTFGTILISQQQVYLQHAILQLEKNCLRMHTTTHNQYNSKALFITHTST